MTARRIAVGIAAAAFAALLAAAYVRYLHEAEAGLDPDDLARRTALTSPDWANYQEDIKAQIGAGLVAQWQGRPIAARLDGASLNVTFELSGPWAERQVVIPVLVRGPSGKERRHQRYEIQSPRVTYTFNLTGNDASAPMPWIMIKYPHHEERIPLDSQGEWHSEEKAP